MERIGCKTSIWDKLPDTLTEQAAKETARSDDSCVDTKMKPIVVMNQIITTLALRKAPIITKKELK